MYKYVISLLLIGIFFESHSQQNSISVYSEYNLPLGQMKWSYKPAFGAQVHYKRMTDTNSRWTKGAGFGIGYTQFNNLADTLYYVVDKGGVEGTSLGIAVYSPFKIYMFSATLSADRTLSKKASLALGFDVAYYYGQRRVFFADAMGENGVDEINARGTFVPRMGVNFELNDAISIGPYMSYTFMIELGNTNPDSMYYNPETGVFLHYYSAGIALNFYF